MTKEFKFLDAYSDIFYSDKTYFIISGGRGGGKSTNIAAYFVMKLMQPTYFRGVITRFTQRALTTSIYRDIVDLIANWNLGGYIDVKNDEIVCKSQNEDGTNNMIITHAFKMSDGTQTAKGKGISNPTDLLIDEAIEVPTELEYIKLIDSFRTKGVKRKIFVIFNPGAKSHWIFKRWYLPDGTPNPKWDNDHCFIHTTFEDNLENLDESKVQEWRMAAINDPEYYAHHINGEWSDYGQTQVFTNWRFGWHPDPEAEELFAIDWGFASDPTAVVRVLKRGKRLWIEELCYETGLIISEVADILLSKGVGKTATIYADSAEPRSIEELRRLGFRNIKPATKGPDSIRAGINKVKEFEVHINPASKNLINEYQFYSYKPGTDKPLDDHNHLMDAIRYALSKHRSGPSIALPSSRARQIY